MPEMPSLSVSAFLIADPARAIMLTVLLDGRALPAGELAYAAGVTAQTASSHLAKLRAGGLVAVEAEGRHRYYRLAGSEVAEALESLAAIQPAHPIRRKALSKQAQQLRFGRSCYDHLAGHMGVVITNGLMKRKLILPREDKQFEITARGREWFADLGLDVNALKPTRRGVARQCLDWTERTHHLAGPLGVALLRALCDAGWLRRVEGTRAVQMTSLGRAEIDRNFGIDIDRTGAA